MRKKGKNRKQMTKQRILSIKLAQRERELHLLSMEIYSHRGK